MCQSDIIKFETLEMWTFDDVTLLDLHESGIFEFLAIWLVVSRSISSRKDVKFSRSQSISGSY
jgi:hypothetical protein